MMAGKTKKLKITMDAYVELEEKNLKELREWWHTTPIPELIECPHMRRHACPPGCDKC